MRSYTRYCSTLAAAGLTLLLALGGCSSIGKAIDCDQMCEQIETCIDSGLDVHRCSERCEDKADNDQLRTQLDRCTDCLDQNYACAEVPEECSSCKAVTEALL